jgi:hypothetical protein
MRGQQSHTNQLCPLTLTLSLMERELFNRNCGRLVLLRKRNENLKGQINRDIQDEQDERLFI